MDEYATLSHSKWECKYQLRGLFGKAGTDLCEQLVRFSAHLFSARRNCVDGEQSVGDFRVCQCIFIAMLPHQCASPKQVRCPNPSIGGRDLSFLDRNQFFGCFLAIA